MLEVCERFQIVFESMSVLTLPVLLPVGLWHDSDAPLAIIMTVIHVFFLSLYLKEQYMNEENSKQMNKNYIQLHFKWYVTQMNKTAFPHFKSYLGLHNCLQMGTDEGS